MSPIFLLAIATLVLAQLVVPKKYAFAPILIAAFNLGNSEIVAELTPLRLLILAGMFRVGTSGLLNIDTKNPIDRAILALSFFILVSAPFHESSYGNPYLYRLGLIYNIAGIYYIGKAYLQGPDLMKRIAIVSLITIAPLAIFMILEFTSGKNYYYPHLGASHASASFREGFRAKGPFAHAILAGTSGAVTLPIFIPLWRSNKKLALLGIAAALSVVIASNSSGPMAATAFAIGIIYAWRWRRYLRYAKYLFIIIIIILSLYMERPFYYIIDSIDFTGGSTGWHRAHLIETALDHLDEWWLFGTDYTRHWMPTGVSWNPNHTDLTNYYIHLGVIAGLFATLALVVLIWSSVKRLLNTMLHLDSSNNSKGAFTTWCLLAALAAHASSFISISYFDQMYAVFYLLIACIANIGFNSFAQEQTTEN